MEDALVWAIILLICLILGPVICLVVIFLFELVIGFAYLFGTKISHRLWFRKRKKDDEKKR